MSNQATPCSWDCAFLLHAQQTTTNTHHTHTHARTHSHVETFPLAKTHTHISAPFSFPYLAHSFRVHLHESGDILLLQKAFLVCFSFFVCSKYFLKRVSVLPEDVCLRFICCCALSLFTSPLGGCACVCVFFFSPCLSCRCSSSCVYVCVCMYVCSPLIVRLSSFRLNLSFHSFCTLVLTLH